MKIAPPVSKKVNRNTKSRPTPKANEVTDTYKRDYEFVKPHGENSPVRPWEKRMITEHEDYGSARERTMIMKTHHGFGHTSEQKKGNLRVSAKKGAHQIGKRSKKGK